MKTPSEPPYCLRCRGKGWVYDHREWPSLCPCVRDASGKGKKATKGSAKKKPHQGAF